MLDLKTCKTILNKGALLPYTDEEVEKIAELLWQLAQINCDVFIANKTTT